MIRSIPIREDAACRNAFNVIAGVTRTKPLPQNVSTAIFPPTVCFPHSPTLARTPARRETARLSLFVPLSTIATVIRVTRPADSGAELEVELVRQPSIYLDQDSLTDIARTPARRERF
jgi:hypothetical protein